MTSHKFALILCLLIAFSGIGQERDFTSDLYFTYEKYREPSLEKRRIKHKDIQPLIHKLSTHPQFEVRVVGKSIEGRNLSLISIGTGATDIFLWSQMHGDEPTATQAIFDIFNFLTRGDFKSEKENILKNVKLHFLPMLNPDGAEVYQRRNTLGIDINRDALSLQSPEGRTLKRVRDSLEADFGFNLHDQSTYYNAERTDRPATISYLAPAFNYEKDINGVRANAMKIIVYMNQVIQKYAPGQVGRYNDDFEPRAFGDNIQKWGTSAILIESGGYKNDPEKQEIRKLNYVSILSAIYSIANGNYKNIPISEYDKIPENDRKLFDLKLNNLTYNLLGKNYTLDVGIHQLEIDDASHNTYYNSSRVVDQGDLSTYYGYETLEGKGYTMTGGKVYPKTLPSVKEVSELKALDLLKSGFTYVRVENIPKNVNYVSFPFNIIGKDYKVPEFKMRVGVVPNFILEQQGQPRYAVVNGFLIDLKSGEGNFKNALILR
jgi:hypothetical protein